MHKIFYIKKETLCALLLPTLHNPPVLFSAWREFSTLDRSLASGLLGRASSEGDVQSAEMWTTHQVFLTGTSKALRTSQIKQNRCTFASLSAHTHTRAHARTHTAKSIVRKAGQSVSGGEMRGPRRHLRWVSGAERCAFTEPAGGQAAFLHFSPHFW